MKQESSLSVYNLLYFLIWTLLGPHIFLSTLMPLYSFRIRNRVRKAYKVIGKIIMLHSPDHVFESG
jgi:hypothetical protein